MGALQSPWVRWALLVLLAGVVTIIEVNFVGDATLYSLHNNATREESHERIVHNRAPEGGWGAEGLNGTNIRIAVPYLVEFLHQVTPFRVLQLYKGVDTICLWLSLIVFFAYLQKWFTVREGLIAWLYLAAILPLTFAFHSYHPWDRPSFLAWLLAFWAARSQRFWLFCLVSAVAVLIKYDAAILPVFYLLANFDRKNWLKILVQAGALGVGLLAIYAGLRALLPGGFAPHDFGAIALRNLAMIARNPISYTPFLAFGLPVLLGIFGYKIADRFVRASFCFGGIILALLFIATNFEEVRAEIMVFPLLAPAALLGVRRLARESAPPQRA